MKLSRLARLCFVLYAIGLAFFSPAAQSQDLLRVGVHESPPFVIHDGEGNWSGIAFELWKNVAKDLEVLYTVKAFDHEGLENAIEKGEVDVGISSLAISLSHLDKFDYSRTFFHSDLSIAGHVETSSSIGNVIKALFSPTVLMVLGGLFLLVMFGAWVFWALEKHDNPTLYDKTHGKGNFSNGIMWAILLVTAQEPDIFKNNSFVGRLIAMGLLFVGVTVSASYIALITSSLTVSEIRNTSISKQDLPFIRVAAIHDSRATEYLDQFHIKHAEYDEFEAMMEALENRHVDAVVADAAKLTYYSRRHSDSEISVLPVHLSTEYFAFALPKGSKWDEQINPAISEFVESVIWTDIIKRYIGDRTEQR